MTATRRPFDPRSDFTAIGEFLTGLYLPGNRDGNWFSAVWEYAYTHPWFDEGSVSRIGVWEADGRIVAVATYEFGLGEAFFHVRPGFEDLKPQMLDHAEANFPKEGGIFHVFAPDFERTTARGGRRTGFQVIADIVDGGFVLRRVARRTHPVIDHVVAEVQQDPSRITVGPRTRTARLMVCIKIVVIRNIPVRSDE